MESQTNESQTQQRGNTVEGETLPLLTQTKQNQADPQTETTNTKLLRIKTGYDQHTSPAISDFEEVTGQRTMFTLLTDEVIKKD